MNLSKTFHIHECIYFFILTFTALLLLSIANFWLAVIVHRVATLDTSFFPCFTASTISCSHKQFKWVKPTCTSRTTFGNLVLRKLNNYWLVCNQPKQAVFLMSIPNLYLTFFNLSRRNFTDGNTPVGKSSHSLEIGQTQK